MDKVTKVLILSSDKNLKNVLNFCFDGWGYEVFSQDFLETRAPIDEVEEVKRISPDVIVVDIQLARKKQLDICRSLKDNFATAFIPMIALINKRHLRTHLLNLKQGVDDYLIKPPDPLDLRIRIEMSLRRAQHSIHASSLTGLPGGKILEDVLKEKIKNNIPFSFGYLDIDNFKSFNDIYSYQKGDRAILQTAYMLLTIIKSLGNADDFISHIGGDDFVFITTPDKYEQICHHFIQMFDNVIPFQYSGDDRKQGFVIARDRTRKLKKIPLMSISIAIVNTSKSFNFKNTIDATDKIAEIKRYLKTIPNSKFMADRRDVAAVARTYPQIHNKKDESDIYKPLGQILLEEKVISHEQLDEALGLHWNRGVALGEVLKDLGFINDETLVKALSFQKVKFSYQTLKS